MHASTRLFPLALVAATLAGFCLLHSCKLPTLFMLDSRPSSFLLFFKLVPSHCLASKILPPHQALVFTLGSSPTCCSASSFIFFSSSRQQLFSSAHLVIILAAALKLLLLPSFSSVAAGMLLLAWSSAATSSFNLGSSFCLPAHGSISFHQQLQPFFLPSVLSSSGSRWHASSPCLLLLLLMVLHGSSCNSSPWSRRHHQLHLQHAFGSSFLALQWWFWFWFARSLLRQSASTTSAIFIITLFFVCCFCWSCFSAPPFLHHFAHGIIIYLASLASVSSASILSLLQLQGCVLFTVTVHAWLFIT